ncbi:MAG: hypothetical protein K5930_04930 [Treponemataceae bacterium]|nr:hypothetical protein [Treponemataceae bacterium]
MKKRKFIILYLDTGGGHKSPAMVLKSFIENLYPGSEAIIKNGFRKQDRLPNLFFVDFYHVSMNSFSSIYSFVYRLGNNYPFVRISHLLLQQYTIPYIKKIIREEKPTDIINLHFALESAVRSVKRSNPEIRVVNIVTDPFTVHSSWFYDKKAEYFVFSDRVRQYALQKCKIPEKNVKVLPFVLNPKYRERLDQKEICSLKEKYGLNPDKKVVLVAGGGDGNPFIKSIVNEIMSHNPDFIVIAVCGRDNHVRKNLERNKEIYGYENLIVYGFVDFMEELVKICDCAVIKAGASSLMEVLASRKPVVICDFIYGQELGNVQFAVDNGLGKFCRKPSEIYDAVYSLVSDERVRVAVEERLSRIPISFETEKVVHMLFETSGS